jgi:hypothetical protein
MNVLTSFNILNHFVAMNRSLFLTLNHSKYQTFEE